MFLLKVLIASQHQSSEQFSVNTPLCLSFSGSGCNLSTPPLCQEAVRCRSCPTLGSGLGPALRALSQAAQEITEICSVDQTGCEDPDLDADTAAHTLHQLGQELRLTIEGTPPHGMASDHPHIGCSPDDFNTTSASETGSRAAAFGALSSGSPDQHRLTRWVRRTPTNWLHEPSHKPL